MKNLPSENRETPMTPEEVTESMQDLTPDWKVVDNHHLIREFHFKNFREALSFANEVGVSAEEEKHHPDILLKYGEVDITLCTHKINGLSKKDFTLAHKIEADFSSFK